MSAGEKTTVTRRSYVKTLSAGVVGLAVGLAAGYGVSASMLPPPAPGARVTETVTQTVAGGTVIQTVSAAAAPVGGYPGQKKYTLKAVGGDLGGEFWIPIWAGLPDAAALFNVTLTLEGPSGVDAKMSHDTMDAAIAARPDAILASLGDATMEDLMAKAIDQGIPCVAFLIDDLARPANPHPSKRFAYIGTNQYDAMFTTSLTFLNKYLLPKYPKGGKGVVFSHRPGAVDLENRISGVRAVLEPAGFTMDYAPAGPSAAEADDMALAYLRTHPDVVVAAGVDGISTPAAGNAIDKTGTKDTTLGFGTDLVPRNLDLLQKGCLWALMNQQPYVMLPVAVESLVIHLVSNAEIMPFDASTAKGVGTPENISKFLTKSKWH